MLWLYKSILYKDACYVYINLLAIIVEIYIILLISSLENYN